MKHSPKNSQTKILVLMVLRTPPPYGGGEIRGAALHEYVKNSPDFVVLAIHSKKRNKRNQSSFAFWKITEFISTLFQFIILIVRHKPKLIFYPMAKSFPHFLRDSIFFWTAWLLKVPFAGELAGASFYFFNRSKIQTSYGKAVISRMACLRVLGKSIAHSFKEFGITNTIVSDNGIDPLKSTAPPTPTTCSKKIRILFVGTLSPQKGFDLLVDACINLLYNGNDSFEVHCMGEWISDTFKKHVASKLNTHRISDNFVFHGLSHGPQKHNIFSNSHFLILPSYIEGQPLVILEALSYGLPIISTKVGAIPDTIKDGKNGFLIEVGNSVELENRIFALLSNQDLRKEISLINLKLYHQRFTKERFLKTQVYWIKECAKGTLQPQGQFVTAPTTHKQRSSHIAD